MMQKYLFIDRDGTLIEEPFDYQVDSLDKIKLTRSVIPALLELSNAGFKLIMISNQDGLGTDSFPQEDFDICHAFIVDLFSSQGIMFDAVYICPHLPGDNCICRKPKTALLETLLREGDIDKQNSWVIGDRESDKELAKNIDVSFLAISKEQTWAEVVTSILNTSRSATVSRVTKETAINLSLCLDSNSPGMINTPLPFFNHMLEQVATHGGFNLVIDASGDIEVDDHHLIEDTALALGEALKTALGDKWGINRYGFTLPMDESLASIAMDISGRSFCEFKGQFTREFVGGMATEMVPHFFKSLASSLGAAIHLNVTGSNNHHMVEACFKSLGRVLRMACLRSSDSLPSTKGSL